MKIDKTRKADVFVSVVVANSEDGAFAVAYIEAIHEYLISHYSDFEIVIIDDRQNDLKLKNDLLSRLSSIRWIKLSYLLDSEAILNVGIENAIGDYVIILRPEIDPIDVINDMIDISIRENSIVVGIANQPSSISYRFFRKLSTKALASVGYNIPQNSTSLICLSRENINAILKIANSNHKLLIQIFNSGYPIQGFEYKLIDSKRLKKRSLRFGISTFFRIMIFTSTKPLRWIGNLGILGAFFSLIFSTYSIIVNVFKDNVVEGWTTITFFLSISFMLVFIILSFIGEYLSRLVNEDEKRKNYYVSEEARSTRMTNIDRFNVDR